MLLLELAVTDVESFLAIYHAGKNVGKINVWISFCAIYLPVIGHTIVTYTNRKPDRDFGF